MRKAVGFLLLALVLVSFSVHQFYVSIYQIQYAPEKKRLQITSRIFIDDLNAVLEAKNKQKAFLGEKNESAEDVSRMKDYLLQHFSIKVNGQPKPIQFLSHEFENNVVICYFTVKDATKIKTMEIRNTALFELHPEQQNIINANVSGDKESLLLTTDEPVGVLKFN
ncbi:DUF6702 family protein [Flavobacterium sp.]|uniref:DUF6702 family protein n=1 Tax=Flavobacterium sp. TaxID=239 RepID=UPI0039E6DFF2